LGFLTLLVEEYGEPSVSEEDAEVLRLLSTLSSMPKLAVPLADCVTVTRLMLCQRGLLVTQPDNLICLPPDYINVLMVALLA